MQVDDIRQAFRDFFVARGHSAEDSSPVIPQNDPTLLFANAGMNQFKNVFTGAETRPYTRATTCQKCIRAGGKHNDLENVGMTPRHHTFFEMLGNFSFGDYFKEEAIAYAWELLTDVYGLPKKYLWISVFEEDDEAEKLWQAHVPASQIVRLGKKDNFWEMGDTGPCGPCSEISLDLRPFFGTAEKLAAFDDDYCLELWNLVFMQFNRQEDSAMHPLPRPSVDTGAGLERLASVLQRAHSNYEIDVFAPLIDAVASLSGVPYVPLEMYGAQPMTTEEREAGMPHRVIADHIRALAFALADGAVPSNEGRGYVLRRILRRAARYGRRIGCEEPFLASLLPRLVESMGDVYPVLRERQETIASLIYEEEKRFSTTLSDGMSRFMSLVDALPLTTQEISGEDAFTLYDTYGFPLDITRDMAHERGLTVDEQGFEACLAQQRERAKAAQKGVSQVVTKVYEDVYATCGDTRFVGYDTCCAEGTVTALMSTEGAVCDALTADDSGALQGVMIVSDTPFYGTSGGQESDCGTWRSTQASGRVVRVTRPVNQMFAHDIIVEDGTLAVGDTVTLEVDEERRLATMRHHTAAHLFHAALHAVLGPHATQAGSSVSDARMRFDFHHPTAVTADELRAIEEYVNARIFRDMPVTVEETTLAEAKATGAQMLFDEKYGETVRVVRIGQDSCELCGGTHASRTGMIGMFLIQDESSVAAGIRRIEAVCGSAAYVAACAARDTLKEVALLLNVASEAVPEKTAALQKELKDAKKKLKARPAAAPAIDVAALLASAHTHDGTKLVVAHIGDGDATHLRQVADAVRAQLPSYIIVLASQAEGKGSFIAQVSEDRIRSGDHAGKLIKELAAIAGGGGGGKPASAQAGGADPKKIDQALAAVPSLLTSH